jgi:hypothetical protein
MTAPPSRAPPPGRNFPTSASATAAFLQNQIQSTLGGAQSGQVTFQFTQPGDLFYFTAFSGAPTSVGLPFSTGQWQLTSAVPEPGTAATLLGGLAVLGAVASRRKSRG